MIKRVIKWLCHNDSFRTLSNSIIHSRGLISKYHSRLLELEARVWELEDHTSEETLRHVAEKLRHLNAVTEQYKKTTLQADPADQEKTDG